MTSFFQLGQTHAEVRRYATGDKLGDCVRQCSYFLVTVMVIGPVFAGVMFLLSNYIFTFCKNSDVGICAGADHWFFQRSSGKI